VTGEHIRKDVRENQPGVTLHLDMQVYDIKTCLPIPKAAVEIWGTNATGSYSGITGAGMDFLGGAKVDGKANLQNRAMRGIQITDKDGAVQFDTLYPGHYSGRTNHIHVMTHTGQEELPNKTIKGGKINHVGQIYFDQSLTTEVEKTAPYADNKQQWTLNKADMIMAGGTSGNADNVVNYVLLGNKLEDGVFGWINFGIDAASARDVRVASECTDTECKEVPFKFPDFGALFGGKGKGAPKGGAKAAAPKAAAPPAKQA
ncbi:aromatic compound dioxygenase, partial [Microthyrium microscopicum]